MANEIFEPEQAWRFCDVCDTQKTRPFSAERAYIKHQTSQGHLKNINQPLHNVPCPKCGKSLSQESAVRRHLTSGQCPGHRPTLNPIPESSVPLPISWKGPGEKVYVTGTFVQWDRKFKLHRDKKGGFSTILQLKPGTHHLKFLVDGDMTTSHELPTTVDYTNILVNYIEVVAPLPEASEKQEPAPAEPMPTPGAALTHGQVPGTTLNPIPESSRKHALSVSPNGIAWKIQKSAASYFEAGGTSLHTLAAPSMSNSSWSLQRPIPPHLCFENIASSSSKSSEDSTGSTDPHDNIDEILATSTPKLSHATPMGASPDNQTPESDVSPTNRRDRIDDTNDANNELRVVNEERRLSSPQLDETPITTSTLPPNEGEETDQRLSVAMESASLKDDNFAYSQVQGLMSSTPATSMSSWGSLFLKHSPRLAVVGWSHSPLSKASPRSWSSVRSTEMPAPMLTGPVDEELRMSRRTRDQPTKKAALKRVFEPRNRNEEFIELVYLNRYRQKLRMNLIDNIDLDYRSKRHEDRTVLMLAVAQRQQYFIYTLLKGAFAQGKWPTLSMLDASGDTISSIAWNERFSRQLNEILRLFVAVACCECKESRRWASVCGRLAQKGFLEYDERQSTEPGCRWGMKLCHPEWPCPERERDWCQVRAETALKEIDDRIQELKACCFDAFPPERQMQRMLSEWVSCEGFFS